MAECTNEMQIEHATKLGAMSADISHMKEALMNISTITKAIVRLELLFQQNSDFNEKRGKADDDLKNTLTSIDRNLTTLSNKVVGLDERVTTIETSDAQENFMKIEEKKEDKRIYSERYKANMMFYGVIASCVFSLISLIVAFVLNGSS